MAQSVRGRWEIALKILKLYFLQNIKEYAVNTTPLGPFVGMNNRLPDHKLSVSARGEKVGDYLRNAVNVDLTNSGTLQRRKGTTLAQAGSDCHSLWAEGVDALYVDGSTLYSYPRTIVREGLTRGMHCSYTHAPMGEIYWSNGVVLERIVGGASEPASLPVPNPQPSVVATGGGALKAGYYQVAITAVSASGEESGATWPVQVKVPDSGRIEVTNLPGSRVNIYVSPQNSEVLLFAAQTTAASYIFPLLGTLGQQCTTLGLREMPPGQHVRWFNQRLLVASGNILYYGEPASNALYNPMKGYIPFPARISVVEPCQNGVYVVADQTYWLAGTDVSTAEVVPALPYGAVEGTGGRTPNTNEVWWFSHRGAVMGDESGKVKNLQEENVAVDPAQVGASLYREQDGMRQLVSSVRGGDTTIAKAGSFATAEIIRKENML